MPQLSQLFIKSAVLYVIIGMAAGIGMSMAQDHRLMGAHAHLNLIGWASMALFGLYYNAAPAKAATGLARAQFWVSTLGIWVMIPGLALLLLGYGFGEPITAVGSLITLLGMLLFAAVVFRR